MLLVTELKVAWPNTKSRRLEGRQEKLIISTAHRKENTLYRWKSEMGHLWRPKVNILYLGKLFGGVTLKSSKRTKTPGGKRTKTPGKLRRDYTFENFEMFCCEESPPFPFWLSERTE